MPRLRWVVVTALLLVPALARADFFSTSPGPLAQVHANIDSKDHCTDCHTSGRELSQEKCLKCHEPIGERQRDRKGVHASPKALGKPCELCHTDHKGRNKNILGFEFFGGREKFDHNLLTPFQLEGKHQTTKCNDCHKDKTASGTFTYLKAPTQCASCHDNPHGDLHEKLRNCERCHDARSWKMKDDAQFDHDRDTRYPIEKKHEPAKCVQCHAVTKSGQPPNSKAAIPALTAAGYQKMTFRWPTWGFDCQPCHDNVHGTSLFGTKSCKSCHSAKVEFTKINFDHNKRTRFPLEGEHADTKKATCYSCHPKELKSKPSMRCDGCHQDVHKGRFAKVSSGNECGVCHTAVNWPTDLKFDHNTRTKFPLTGAHANADCRACHRGKGPAEWENVSSLVTRS
ncbi:MAG TPA: cytochrome c3 family protein, partial [Polyangiaceae bacterium]|nr:cytochrome c3 family protein [Polyangiaceae bacterium]